MGQLPKESHDFIHENENMCGASAIRDRSPSSEKPSNYGQI